MYSFEAQLFFEQTVCHFGIQLDLCNVISGLTPFDKATEEKVHRLNKSVMYQTVDSGFVR